MPLQAVREVPAEQRPSFAPASSLGLLQPRSPSPPGRLVQLMTSSAGGSPSQSPRGTAEQQGSRQ